MSAELKVQDVVLTIYIMHHKALVCAVAVQNKNLIS